MKPFDVVQSFILESAQATSPSALTAAFRSAVEHLGFRYFALVSHVNPLRPPPGALVIHNYPAAWAREFSERGLHLIDPVLQHAERTLLPFFWDSEEFRAGLSEEQRDILVQGAAYGLAHGYTIPIHMPWKPGTFRASCSLVPDSAAIEPSGYFCAQIMAMHMYEAATRALNQQLTRSEPAHTLSLRERQCLELAAQGKSNWSIGQILGISEHTVHRYFERAKSRLGVATRMQAVIRAFQSGQISIGDVCRAENQADDTTE